MILPEGAREVVEAYAGAVPFANLRRAAALLSETYRAGQATRAVRLPAEERTAAYLAVRMPATYAAALAVLEEVRSRTEAVPASLLDAGGGTGAAALAASQVFSCERITVVERDAALAAAGRRILPRADWRTQELGDPGEYDLVVAGYSLGELHNPEETALRLWLAARMALVIIEPGTTRGFSLVRRLRERLLAAGAHMLAPCPAETPCPMAGSDWCHFAARVERSGLHRRLKQGSLAYEDEKFSYLVVSRASGGPAPARVIRHPRHQPGMVTLEICGVGGLSTVPIPKGRKQAFRAARKTHWGDAWYF